MCDYNEISTNVHIFYNLGYRYFNNGTYLTDNVIKSGWYLTQNGNEEFDDSFELLVSKHEQLKWKVTDEILRAITQWVFDNSEFSIEQMDLTWIVKNGEGIILFSGFGNCQLYDCLKFLFRDTVLYNKSIIDKSRFQDNWIRQFGD